MYEMYNSKFEIMATRLASVCVYKNNALLYFTLIYFDLLDML